MSGESEEGIQGLDKYLEGVGRKLLEGSSQFRPIERLAERSLRGPWQEGRGKLWGHHAAL